MLRIQLSDVQVRQGTGGCVVESGVLADPYTGRTVNYRRGQQPTLVVVDHT